MLLPPHAERTFRRERFTLRGHRPMERGMEQLGTILEREGDALEALLFKLVETNLLLKAGEARFLPRATREVERARGRAAELDLLRATTVAETAIGSTLRGLAAEAPSPWPGILRDHHEVLSRLVAEIEVVAHQNAQLAERCLAELSEPAAAQVAARTPAGASDRMLEPTGWSQLALEPLELGGPSPTASVPTALRPVRNAELDRLARGAALHSVLNTAARLRLPDLLDFLR
jgi:hypothetical protein